MRLIARRQQIGRNITLGGNIGDHFNLFFNIGQLGEKLGCRIAFENIFGNLIIRRIGRLQARHIGLIEKYLRLQHVAGLPASAASSPSATSSSTSTDGPPFICDKSSKAKSVEISSTVACRE